uniref:Uncharacterized protein n=1 Tax=Oryza sativa subsp. japonica TaxID=39947 RepID=Q6YWP7_ORYSJ|nr:hypothetical protein [Oryza sativa Japonica Group]BAD16371.1 hypothetical protein [Oryza sativa Japonica Group]
MASSGDYGVVSGEGTAARGDGNQPPPGSGGGGRLLLGSGGGGRPRPDLAAVGRLDGGS